MDVQAVPSPTNSHIRLACKDLSQLEQLMTGMHNVLSLLKNSALLGQKIISTLSQVQNGEDRSPHTVDLYNDLLERVLAWKKQMRVIQKVVQLDETGLHLEPLFPDSSTPVQQAGNGKEEEDRVIGDKVESSNSSEGDTAITSKREKFMSESAPPSKFALSLSSDLPVTLSSTFPASTFGQTDQLILSTTPETEPSPMSYPAPVFSAQPITATAPTGNGSLGKNSEGRGQLSKSSGKESKRSMSPRRSHDHKSGRIKSASPRKEDVLVQKENMEGKGGTLRIRSTQYPEEDRSTPYSPKLKASDERLLTKKGSTRPNSPSRRSQEPIKEEKPSPPYLTKSTSKVTMLATSKLILQKTTAAASPPKTLVNIGKSVPESSGPPAPKYIPKLPPKDADGHPIRSSYHEGPVSLSRKDLFAPASPLPRFSKESDLPSPNRTTRETIDITDPTLSQLPILQVSQPSIKDFGRQYPNRLYLKIIISSIGAQYQTLFPADSTLLQVKLELLKKIKRAGVKNLNPSSYYLCIHGLRLLDEKLTLDQMIPEDNQRNEPVQIELTRPLEYELNLADVSLQEPVIVSDTMDVGSITGRFVRICFPNLEPKKYNFNLVGSRRFKNCPEKLDPKAKFISLGFRGEDKLKIVANPKEEGTDLEEQLCVQYSPFDIIDKQKLMLVKKGYLKKQGGSKGGNKSWKKRWMELEDNCLVYYTDNKAKTPKGLVDLTTFVSVEEVTDKRKVDSAFYFSITTSDRSGQVLLSTRTESEMNSWIEHIRKYCNRIRVEQGCFVKVFTLEDYLLMEGLPVNSKKKKKEEASAAAGSISEPFLARKLFSINQEWQWNSNENPRDVFEFIELLGVGACGQVFKAAHKQMMNFELAIKIIKQGDKELQEALEKEIDILKKCRSENVIAYYGTVLRENDTWILMDYCGVGSVKDVMKVIMESLNEDQCRYVIFHTLKGLAYMHIQSILHLDVKAANILLTEQGVVKLADFGVSQVLKSSEIAKGQDYVGSPLFMAPEIIKKQGYNSKADIWSLGITIIEMMEQRPPNNDINKIEMLPQLLERPPPTLKSTTDVSAEFRSFLASLFVKDPANRPSALDLLEVPFMHQVSGPDCLVSMIYECLSLQGSKRKKFTPDMLPFVDT